ncbi:Di-copper centre-containing protein [Ceratobasidium sp. AG-I]|nr:Di-copper centre-containing protein [Ceratobasidium sp. AG-I]
MRRAFAITTAVSLASFTLATSTCDSPYVRKEWRQLNTTEQEHFIAAVKCLGDLKHSSSLVPTNYTTGIASVTSNSSRYDDFIYAHMDTNIKDHFTGLFLPWHRWYLRAFENALRDECEYPGYLPYWDWSRDTSNIPAAPVFSSSNTTGFGKFGTIDNNYTVTDGAFSTVVRAYPTPHIITRNYLPQPFQAKVFPFNFTYPNKYAVEAFTPTELSNIISNFTGDFVSFAAYMDGKSAQGMHNAAHLMMIPGDMSNPSYSPNDPLFFLHHANLDRIWSLWQANHTENAGAYGGGSVQDLEHYDVHPVGAAPNLTTAAIIPTSGLEANPTVSDVMSTKGGYLCFTYSNSTSDLI